MPRENVPDSKAHTIDDFIETGKSKTPRTDPLTNDNFKGRLATTTKIYTNNFDRTLVPVTPHKDDDERFRGVKTQYKRAMNDQPHKIGHSQEKTKSVTITTKSKLILRLIGAEDANFSEKIQELLKFVEHYGFWMIIARRNVNTDNEIVKTSSDSTIIKEQHRQRNNLTENSKSTQPVQNGKTNKQSDATVDGFHQCFHQNVGNVLSLNTSALTSAATEAIQLKENYSEIRRLLLHPLHYEIIVKHEEDDILECAVLVSGGVESLEIIKKFLRQKIPIICVKGSGGVADYFFDLSKKKKSNGKLPLECAEIYKAYPDLLFYLDLKGGDYLNKLSKVILKSLNGVTQENDKKALAYGSLSITLNQLEELMHHERLNGIFKTKDSNEVKKLTNETVQFDQCKILEYLLDNGHTQLENIKPDDVTEMPGSLQHGASPQTDSKDKNSKKKSSFWTEIKNILRINSAVQEKHPSGDSADDLFKKAIKTKRLELSKLLWLKVEHPTGAALYAYGKLDKMERRQREDFRSCKVIKEMKKVFLEYAIATINLNYSRDAEKTRSILLMNMESWGNTSCVKLAMKTDNGKFLSQPPCSELRKSLFKSRMKFNSKEDTDQNKNEINHPSPKVLMFLNLIGVAAFLIAYAVLLVSFLKTESFHILEWIILACVITFLLELINQLARNSFSHLRPGFLVLSIISQILFLVAWILRIAAYFEPGNPEFMIWARIIFSLDFIVFSLTVLEFCYMSRFLGPLIETLWQMISIFIRFCAIILVLFFAYAIASESVLNPITEPESRVPFYLFRKAFWGMFADFMLEELETDATNTNTKCSDNPSDYNSYETLRCPSYSGRYYVSILLGVYFIAVNLFIFNVLIAKFSSKIKQMEERATEVWALQIMTTTMKYYYLVFPPIPFIFLTPILVWIQFQRRGAVKLVREERSKHEHITLSNMQDDVRKSYIDSLEEKPDLLLVQCTVHCPHQEGQNIIHERVVTLPTKSERLTEEAAVAVLATPRNGVLDNDSITSRSNGKEDTRKRYFAVRSKYKYGIRWQCVAVKPRVERAVSVQESDFDVNVGYSLN
ncbi:unnamed protein product [Lymnaea stagnalis]|uniref:TRPM SLOG domain-containing protein n=1 Tax=Lymnaea stagnalis TaxID=6523 RepID=A0AAV2HAT1_LYMST